MAPTDLDTPPPGLCTRHLAATAAVTPGVLAGAHLAGLLFFLNPELPFRLLPLLRGVAAYAATLGAASLVAHLPWVLTARRTCRFLPWSLALVLLGFALIDGGHASWYAYYLPSGINVRLLKAAAWLALAGLISLYTALAHTWSRRPYGRRTRWGLALLVVLSLYVIVERREAYQPRPEPTPVRSVVEGQRQVDLYVVGVDAATLDALLPLAEQGRLPFVGALLREGAHARLRSFTPTRSQPLWTTLATGKYPFRHGVRGNRLHLAPFLFPGAHLRLLPAGLAFDRWGLFAAPSLPVPRSERRALALWEILARLGMRTGVVGWPEAAPAPGLAFALADGFFAGASDPSWPPDLAARAALFRVGPAQIDPALLEGFGKPPAAAVSALADDLWRETLTFWLLDQEPEAHAVFLRLPGLAAISQRWFGGYVAHDLEGEQGERTAAAARLVEEYYRHLDDYLGQLWNRTRGPRLLAVVSPYGVSAAGGWRRAESLGRTPLEGDLSGRADGVLLLRGEGVRTGSFAGEAAIEDVVPTLLYGLGLPAGRDMDGRTLTAPFEPSYLAAHPLSFVPSYEALTR